MALGKRRRSGRSFGSRKRRRFGRTSFRRRRGFRRGGIASTGQWGRPFAVNFRRRRMPVRRWRRIIFRDTEAKAHYRSTFAFNDPTFATPNNMTVAQTWFRTMLQAETVNFWTVAGGLVDKDFGEAPPAFRDDKIIRGGYARISISSNTDAEALMVKVWAVWLTSNPNLTRLALVTSNANAIDWEPSMFPDFQRIAKVLYNRQAILRAGDNPFTVVHRLKPQKIDDDVYAGLGSQLGWIVSVSKLTVTQAVPVAQQLNVVYSYNLSFSADAAT